MASSPRTSKKRKIGRARLRARDLADRARLQADARAVARQEAELGGRVTIRRTALPPQRPRSVSPRRRLFFSPQLMKRDWYEAVKLACLELGIETTIIAKKGTKLHEIATKIYRSMSAQVPPAPPRCCR